MMAHHSSSLSTKSRDFRQNYLCDFHLCSLLIPIFLSYHCQYWWWWLATPFHCPQSLETFAKIISVISISTPCLSHFFFLTVFSTGDDGSPLLFAVQKVSRLSPKLSLWFPSLLLAYPIFSFLPFLVLVMMARHSSSLSTKSRDFRQYYLCDFHLCSLLIPFFLSYRF